MQVRLLAKGRFFFYRSEWFGNEREASIVVFYHRSEGVKGCTKIMFLQNEQFFSNCILSDEGPISLEAPALRSFYGVILALISLLDTKFLILDTNLS